MLRKLPFDAATRVLCETGEVDALRELWESSGARSFGVDGGGEGPMHAAARTGQNLVVEWIFSVKPDYLDKIDEDGRSALLWASWNGHAEPVRAMCVRGAAASCCRDVAWQPAAES